MPQSGKLRGIPLVDPALIIDGEGSGGEGAAPVYEQGGTSSWSTIESGGASSSRPVLLSLASVGNATAGGTGNYASLAAAQANVPLFRDFYNTHYGFGTFHYQIRDQATGALIEQG